MIIILTFCEHNKGIGNWVDQISTKVHFSVHLRHSTFDIVDIDIDIDVVHFLVHLGSLHVNFRPHKIKGI